MNNKINTDIYNMKFSGYISNQTFVLFVNFLDCSFKFPLQKIP